MKKIIQIIMILSCFPFGQTADQIKKAKKIINQTGMSESQVRSAAKAQGYTDRQINDAIQKEKSAKNGTRNSDK